ncbi:hypothetical protein P3W85_30860 [Cupriavidus basilensis]|uniref:DUF4238 domain-containing protein n=1 Tax=Cupriavidus basilensis TaxID=68895 RepID=A0ABT6AXF9_9BURK|nr:hypothetical protein [Cupriavidus basilensis]MDF3837316.1 hypothetical protein [Cupriavidus basilensis]
MANWKVGIDQRNQTRNQHFVSQVEQRLNALNPNARPENQRIYEFEIVDRDRHEVRSPNKNGRPVNGTLSMLDLFSFDVDDSGTRANFERAFSIHEARIKPLTGRLLQAHAERTAAIGQEIFDLFIAKMLNFVRNPYSVAKVLNTFGMMAQHHPTEPAIYRAYERVLQGRRPQQARLCQKLNITDEQYGAWLRVLFMLLTPMAESVSPMLEQVLRNQFLDQGHALLVHVHTFSSARCLLSDRGITSPIPQDTHLVFDFNLSAHSFIRYAFVNYEAVLGRALPDGVAQGLRLGPKQLQVSYSHDDLPALDLFHRRVIEQSSEKVFCSGPSPYGVTLID